MLLFINPLIAVHAFAAAVSIHLMLLFIGKKVYNSIPYLQFQYISCYSLSLFVLLFFQDILSFQYISCYSLSKPQGNMIQLQFPFQYISCYSLSKLILLMHRLPLVSIHLMLLFINMTLLKKCARLMFQYISCYSLSLVL